MEALGSASERQGQEEKERVMARQEEEERAEKEGEGGEQEVIEREGTEQGRTKNWTRLRPDVRPAIAARVIERMCEEGACRRQFGGLWGAVLGPLWGLFWASWGPLGVSWGPLEGLLRDCWAPLGAEGSKCRFVFPL